MMSTHLSFFTSPLEGEVDDLRASVGGREGGDYHVHLCLNVPPSLTLPRKGGGNGPSGRRAVS